MGTYPNLSITLGTYSHVIPGLSDAAASAMEDLLGSSVDGGGRVGFGFGKRLLRTRWKCAKRVRGTMAKGDRSLSPITLDDLARLRHIAREDRESFFARLPRYRALEDRVLAVALCQGAAAHFLDGKNGVKDFDVWTFYAAHPDVTYPARRRVARDFGDPKFGQTPDRMRFVGRRVDLLGRSLKALPGSDPVEALHAYLTERRTKSARHLASKAVVLIEPTALVGQVVWPNSARR